MTKSYHSIERTSPKGEGQIFVGRCIRCGKEGLTFLDIREECDNLLGVSEVEALVSILEKAEEEDGLVTVVPEHGKAS